MSQTENDNIPLPVGEHSLAAEVKLYYDLARPYEPILPNSVPESPAPRPLLIVLHGYGGNKRQMMREAQLIAPQGFALASLQGPHQHLKEPREKDGPLRYGFGWLTNFHPEESVALHHNALLDLIDLLSDERVADSQRIFLLGFSQSCALNYRFAFTHPQRLRGVIGICGGLPGDWETSATYKTTDASVLHLQGTRDEFYPPERTRDYLERLRTRARDVEVKAHDAAHETTPAMRDDIRAWLKSKSEG
ncbi:MAG TPA: dienelactone hydrolase family protein [Pyrinomonadaceae bacterium]|jgi:phospholipase/carboxylesterase|nr:dienelactone hydrolase family protein [Pyrinomonadaceae bacterium]